MILETSKSSKMRRACCRTCALFRFMWIVNNNVDYAIAAKNEFYSAICNFNEIAARALFCLSFLAGNQIDLKDLREIGSFMNANEEILYACRE